MKVIDRKLKNGVKLRILNSEEFKSSKIIVKFNSGYLSESREKNQIAHVLEHILCDLSNEDRDWIARSGAETNAQTWEEYTRYFIETLPEFFEKAVDLQLRAIENPKISDESVKREISNVRSEFSNRRQTPLNKLYDIKMEEIFPNTINDQTALSSLDNITLGDIRRHYDQFYTTDNVRILIFGNFSTEEISRVIKRIENFALPRGEEKTFPGIKISDKRGAKISKNEDKTHLMYIPYSAEIRSDPRLRAAWLLVRNFLMDFETGKIYREVRDNGLLYSIYLGLNLDQNSLPNFEFSFSADSENFDKIIEIIEKWISFAKNAEFSDEEFERLRIISKNKICMKLRKVELRVNWHVWNFLLFGGYGLEDLLAEFDKVTKDDFVKIVKIIFDNFKVEE
ncbi:MAG: pitrilysin family protein [bacterium]|nr:pitrilysin family protein [bacterium]